VYVAGHNVIVYKMDETNNSDLNGNQYFLPGSDDTEAITAIGMSFSGKYVFMCERGVEGKKGKLTIFETLSHKKKKTLPESIDQENSTTSPEFVAAAFSPREDKMIVTLTGAPDW